MTNQTASLMNYMVTRPASFAPYWAESASFGPMSKEDAQKMVESPHGGFMMTCEEFRKAGHR